MSDLAKEVAAELKGSGLNWWQRSALIVASNVVGLVLGALVIAAGSIVWNKAMSTDDIKDDIQEHAEARQKELADYKEAATAERAAILETVATLSAEVEQLGILAKEHAAAEALAGNASNADDIPGVPFLPLDEPDPPQQQQQQQIVTEPSAADVRAKKQELQQRIDEEVYRARHLRSP